MRPILRPETDMGMNGPEQHEGRRNLGAIDADGLAQPVADRPIADLIVILDEAEEAMLRQVADGRPWTRFRYAE